MLTPVRSQLSWQRSLGAPDAASSRRRAPRGLIKLGLVASVAVLALGCSASGLVDETENAVVLVLNSITPTTEHAFGDVITNGTIFDDTVEVKFSAHLKAPIATDPLNFTPELQDIVLERYEVTYTRTDGGTAVPPGFVRGLTARVRLTALGSGELKETVVSLVIFPNTTKAQPPISYLIAPGSEPDTNYTNIQVNARVQFFGKTLAGDEVTVVGFIGINLADFGDPEGSGS